MVSKIQRFNHELYAATVTKLTSGQMSQLELRKEIGSLNKQLE